MTDTKVPVTITFTSPGAKPPIFVAGEFSGWEPQELEYNLTGEEHYFYKNISVEAGGKFQYKFRIGHGDWWVLNESAPVVHDDAGNRNNLLTAPENISARTASEEESKGVKSEEIHIPLLVVEKTDDSKVHGDDFGLDATASQKLAHELRAKDAAPDVEIIREDTDLTNYSKTADEVADSAAKLDREPSPVPTSDAEAGRTGERRMSTTPIPDVARTASEVADSAAQLDQYLYSADESKVEEHNMGASNGSAVGRGVPGLLPHEMPDMFDVEETQPATPVHGPDSSRRLSFQDSESAIDLNDPTLERFPTDRDSILTRIRTSSMSKSPVEEEIRSPKFSPGLRSSRSSSRVHLSPAPILGMISEERQDSKDFKLPESLDDGLFFDKGADGSSSKLKALDSGVSLDKMDTEALKSSKETRQRQIHPKDDSEAVKLPSATELLSPVAAMFTKQEGPSNDGNSMPHPENSLNPSIGAGASLSPVDALPKPVANISTGEQCASPTSANDESISTQDPARLDTAETTGISKANGPKSVLKARSVPAAVVDRPDTPISIKPRADEKENLLQVIWRTVFVGWIGGLITRLCGGRRQA